MSVEIESKKILLSMDSNYFSNLTRSDSDSSNSTLNSNFSTFSSFASSINPSQSISSTSSSSSTQLYSESEVNHSNHQSITSILNNISSQTHQLHQDHHHHHHHEIDNNLFKSQSTSSPARNQLPSPTISFRLYSIQSNLSKTSVSSTSPTSLSPRHLLKSTHINSIHQQLQQDLLQHQDPLISPHTNYSNLDLFSHPNLSPSIQNWSDVPTPTSSVIAKRFSFLAELGIGDAAAEAASILFQTKSVSKSPTPSPTAPTNTTTKPLNNDNALTIKPTLVEKESNLSVNNHTSDENESNLQSLLIPNKQSPSSLTYSARFRPESCWVQSDGYGEVRLIKQSTSSTHSLPIQTKQEPNDYQKYQELYEETQSTHFQVESNPIPIESKPFSESKEDKELSDQSQNQNENQNSTRTRSTSFAQHVRTISSSSNKLKDRLPPTPLKINSLPIPTRNTILLAEPQDQAYDSGSEQVVVESPSNSKPNVTSNRAELHTWLNLDPYPTSGSSDQKTVTKPIIPKLTTELPTLTTSPSNKPINQPVLSLLTRSKTHHVPINKPRTKPNGTKLTILEPLRNTRSSTSSPLSSTDLISEPPTQSSSSTLKPKNDGKKVSPTNSINYQSTPTKRRKSLYQFFKSAIQSSTPSPSPITTPQNSVVRPTLQRRSTRDCAPAPVPLVATVRRTRSQSYATLNPSNQSTDTTDLMYDDPDHLELVQSPFIKQIRRKSAKELMNVLLDVTDDNTFIKLAIENKSSTSPSSASYHHHHHQVDDHVSSLSSNKIGKSELHHLFIIRELIKSEKSYLEHLRSLQEAVEQRNQSSLKTSKSLQRASLYYLPNPTLQSTTSTTAKRSNSTNSSILSFETKLKILKNQLPLLIKLSEILIERISEHPTIYGISKTFIDLEPNFEEIFLGWITVLNRIKFGFKDLRIPSTTCNNKNHQSQSQKNRLSWNDVLIMPVQRVTRYHLFLTELMKLEKSLMNGNENELVDENLVNLGIALERSKSLAEVCNVQI